MVASTSLQRGKCGGTADLCARALATYLLRQRKGPDRRRIKRSVTGHVDPGAAASENAFPLSPSSLSVAPGRAPDARHEAHDSGDVLGVALAVRAEQVRLLDEPNLDLERDDQRSAIFGKPRQSSSVTLLRVRRGAVSRRPCGRAQDCPAAPPGRLPFGLPKLVGGRRFWPAVFGTRFGTGEGFPGAATQSGRPRCRGSRWRGRRG